MKNDADSVNVPFTPLIGESPKGRPMGANENSKASNLKKINVNKFNLNKANLKRINNKKMNSKNLNYIKPIVSWMSISCIIGILFYDSLIISLLMFFFFPAYIKRYMKSYDIKEKKELEAAFNDALHSMSSALEAGYSIENSLFGAIRDLKLIYPDSSRIINEFEFMNNQIKNNVSTEVVFQEFAARCSIEDIENFSEILIIAKKTGGDIIKIIKAASLAISEKSEVMQDIHTAVSGKKYEAMIMKSVPFLILLYFRMFSPEYLTILYEGISGAAIMTVLLILYIAANTITDKIISIEV